MKKYKFVSLLGIVAISSLLASCQGVMPIEGVYKGAGESAKSTATETEAGDFNVYLSYEGERADRCYVWAWNREDTSIPGALFPISSSDYVTFDGIDSGGVNFLALHLKFNTVYECFTSWNDDVEGTPSSTFTITEDAFWTGLLFRDATGNMKNVKGDLLIDKSKIKKDANGHYNVWVDDAKGVYYSEADFPVTPIDTLTYKEVNDGENTTYTLQIKGKTSSDLTTFFNEKYRDYILRKYRYVDGEKKYVRSVFIDTAASTIEAKKATLVLKVSEPLDLTYKYSLSAQFEAGGPYSDLADLDFSKYYSSRNFELKYYTVEKLGAYVTNNVTVFKTWSPSAMEMTLNLYKDADTVKVTKYEMKKSANGVFAVALVGNLHGYYYTFDVNNYGDVTNDVSDPYAYSSNTNGKRSMVVDFNKVHENDTQYATEKANGWAPDSSNYAGITIMEMHTRDFSSSASWNGTEANRGKFAALHEAGTTLADGIKTGFDYVKELKTNGLTHVQIMPAYDFASVDETKLDDAEYKNKASGGIYNWGYDPQQYNAPEGSYSSNPNDGNARVNEFYDFVEAYNEAGVGVVMDVVYNHMPSSTGTSFENMFPGYYFRGNNSSGAGSDLATQRGMVRRFIVDSVVSWATNYHISGFRFDLMGLFDMATMIEVRKALNEVDPDILVYGEAWSMFGGDSYYGTRHTDMATQGNIDTAGDNWVGAFNDDYRDALPGKNDDTTQRGYVQQALGYADGAAIDNLKLDKIYYGLSGTYWTGDTGRPTYNHSATKSSIGASVAYVECHDNLTLYDHFALSRTSAMTENDIHREVIMSNDNLLGSLSTAFFQIGQDFGKSKKITDSSLLVSGTYYDDPIDDTIHYSHNSYNSSDKVNQIDWNLLRTNSDISTSFRTALNRRSTIAAQLGDSYNCADFYSTGKFTTKLIDNKGVISYSVVVNDGTAKKIYYFGQNFTGNAVNYPQIGENIPAYGTVAKIVNRD